MRARTGITLVLAGATLVACASLVDSEDRWTAEQRTVLSSMRISELAPASSDPSNRFETRAASAFGKRLFFDTRLSGNGAVSCATCHDPAKQFQDDRALAHGVGTTARRAMPMVDAGNSPWLFWDGRKDSLWAQALGPLEDAKEHGGNRLAYARVVQENYRAEYESIFPAMPDVRRMPANAGPNGTPMQQVAWRNMSEAERQDVSRVFANIGKSIAAYEKTLHYGAARFDRYVDAVLSGDAAALKSLTPQEKNGLRVFIGKGDCVSCHNGALFSDQHFHNTGVPPRDRTAPDHGRSAAIAKVLQDEFNCLGPYSDAKPAQCQELKFIVTNDPNMEGAFKTPSLRNVALRSPYMHAGQIATLADVMRHYKQAPRAAVGHTERKPIDSSEREMQDLVLFLGSLSGPILEGESAR